MNTHVTQAAGPRNMFGRCALCMIIAPTKKIICEMHPLRGILIFVKKLQVIEEILRVEARVCM